MDGACDLIIGQAEMMRCFILLAISATALSGCLKHDPGDDGNTTSSAAPRSVSVAQVQERSFGGSLVTSGQLVAYDEADVGSSLSGYRIDAVLVQEGDIVHEGQPLAKLDTSQIEASIAQTRAQLAQQEVQARQAQSEAARVRGLDGAGVLTDEQISIRRAQADSARAAVQIARAQFQGLLKQLAHATIRAPVSGLILERTARLGAITSSGTNPLFRIARDQRIELAAEIPEAALGSIAPGAKARVTLPSGLQVEGIVRLLSARIDPKTKLWRTRIQLPIDPRICEGGYARAELLRKPHMGPSIPETALQTDADGSSVTVIDADNRAQSQSVRVGARGGGWVELLDGPPVGARVALGGGAFLLDGDAVRPIDATTGN